MKLFCLEFKPSIASAADMLHKRIVFRSILRKNSVYLRLLIFTRRFTSISAFALSALLRYMKSP